MVHWIIDPSGYIYEAVTSNRIEDVKCTLYYKKDVDAKEVLWNAKEYEQENPLYTNAEGKYAWDVPEGLWRVKYEKEGYETAYSEWLPVPPPQTEVNISLVSKLPPNILYVNCYDSYVDIKFNKYMKCDTLNTTSIILNNFLGENIQYSIEYLDVVTNDKGNLTNEILLKPINNLQENSDYTIKINSNALSYAGIALNENTITKKATKVPKILSDKDSISLELGKNQTIYLTFENINEGKVKCKSNNNISVVLPEIVDIHNGNAEVTFRGENNGNALITFEVENTGITKDVYVNVGNDTSRVIAVKSKNIYINTNEKIELQPKLYPTTENQNFIYLSNNKKIVTVDEKGIIKAISHGNAIITIISQDGKTQTEVNCYVNSSLGDINSDGLIDIFDVLPVLNHVKGKILLNENQLHVADVNKDKEIDIFDVISILNIIKLNL